MIRYNEIEKLMPNGSYETCVGLGYIDSWLEEMEEDYGLELNPDFQRGNVWNEEQQIAYVEFLIRGGKSANIIYFNCPTFTFGACDRKSDHDDLPMQCLDGLQRLTAIRKFLHNELPIFNGNYIDDFEDKKILLRNHDMLKFNVNNLQTRKDILKWYIDYNSAGTYHTKEEIERVRKLLAECK